jgi:hypothetical protein
MRDRHEEDSQETNIHASRGILLLLYSLLLCLYFIRTCVFVLTVLYSAFLSLLTTHNTNDNAPGGILTRNPSKLSALDRSATVIGHNDGEETRIKHRNEGTPEIRLF